MKNRCAAFLIALAGSTLATPIQAADLPRPKAGDVTIMKSSELRPGMQGVAWTVFEGAEPEPIPVDIVGLWKNAWGPRQDVILAKLGGKAQRTNVAGGMSGSPVYVDGKLIGAIALRMSIFSPDAICGITPIELMLEVQDFDFSVPGDAVTPDRVRAANSREIPGQLLAQAVAAGASPNLPRRTPVMVPIETPLTFSGFHSSVLREFGPLFEQLGLTVVQGGASGALAETKPAAGWEQSLQPGDAVAGALVSGDMSITGLGTVTYNDGKRVLAFGHPFFNLGPVSMPMTKGEVLMVLSSAFQPNKFANATEVVGALKQDRHSAIMGVLGEESPVIPVNLKVRSFDRKDTVRKEKDFTFNVFVQQKWTPYLMMVTLFNSIAGLNEFAEEVTYRLSGQVELHDHPNLSLSTMQAAGEVPIPAPMILAGWWGDKFNRLFLNAVKTPRLKRVNATIDLLPERRVAMIETAWTGMDEVDPGSEVPVKVFLQPYRGDRFERDFTVKIPAGLPKGTHKILLSDADTLNRMQSAAAMASRFMDLPETVSLLNQERSNNRLYVSLVQSRPTLFYEDKSLPSLPASVANVMQAGRSGSRRFVAWGESVQEQTTLTFDQVITGNYSLNIKVR
jgi:hypothetical protein